jgi:hypothetical protein
VSDSGRLSLVDMRKEKKVQSKNLYSCGWRNTMAMDGGTRLVAGDRYGNITVFYIKPLNFLN